MGYKAIVIVNPPSFIVFIIALSPLFVNVFWLFGASSKLKKSVTPGNNSHIILRKNRGFYYFMAFASCFPRDSALFNSSGYCSTLPFLKTPVTGSSAIISYPKASRGSLIAFNVRSIPLSLLPTCSATAAMIAFLTYLPN